QDVDEAKLWIKEICDKVEPDLIHFNNFGQVDNCFDCPKLTVFHSCVQTWWQAVKGESAPDEWLEYTHRVQNALLMSDCVVAPGKSILQAAENIYGELPRSQVIYNGISQK